MKYYIYLLIFLGFSGLQAQENLFDQATEFYADEKYEAAIKNYQQILEQGKTSTEVYFNLANCYYKIDEIGPSIYYYNKALQLSPNDRDVQNNLLIAQEKTIDLIEETPKTGLANMVDNLISTFDYNTWAVIAIIFSVGFMFFGAIYYFTRKAGFKRFYFSLAILSFILMSASVFFAYKQMEIQHNKKYAIVFAEEVEVHTEPNHNSPEAFRLHEGTKVKLLDVFNNYAQIELSNNSRGWIKLDAIQEL